nr:ornithine cyclodeaminase family protein [Nitrosomonas nitrosa]
MNHSDAALLMLDRDVVGELLAPSDVMSAVREAFELHSRREGRVFPVIREQLESGGVFGVKAGIVPGKVLLGFKAAGFWAKNRETGGEPHQATVVLLDPHTGRPQCVMDGNAITTIRTGAAGALGLESLARRDSEVLTIFGTGVQATSQLSFALQVLPKLVSVRYLTRDGQPDVSFEAAFESRCEIFAAEDANRAVSESDVIITATPGSGPLFDISAVKPGTHLNCVGADTRGKRELPDGLLASAKVFVDDFKQASQLGELQWCPSLSSTELGDVLSGANRYSRHPDDVTVFDMTGLALQDLTVARQLYEKALQQAKGKAIRWPW